LEIPISSPQMTRMFGLPLFGDVAINSLLPSQDFAALG
jgi:hypothetical protein